MTANERANLVLGFARVLYVNGQATDQTVSPDFRTSEMQRGHIVAVPGDCPTPTFASHRNSGATLSAS